VLTSTATCLPEIAGGAALTVDPLSVEAMADGMDQIDSDSALRSRLIVDGVKRAAQFSWENCAKSTLDVYRRMN
jgi:glycosyltransferase involved in cell wall biosynthesis